MDKTVCKEKCNLKWYQEFEDNREPVCILTKNKDLLFDSVLCVNLLKSKNIKDIKECLL